MKDLGINTENFNPRILYIIKKAYDYEKSIADHCHEYVSFMYVFSGSCTYTIDGEVYHVKKGDTLIFNPGVVHGKYVAPGEEIVELQITFDNICIKNLPKNHLIPKDIFPLISLHKYELDIFKCCYELILEQEKDELGKDLILKALVMKLIVLILKSINDEKHTKDTNGVSLEPYDKTTMVNTIISYMIENYKCQISLDKISKNMYLSPVYISKIFKEETGESPINYLINLRLSKAKELLDDGHFSIKEVAEKVGYADAYHFSKLFKKHFGYPPSKYVSSK